MAQGSHDEQWTTVRERTITGALACNPLQVGRLMTAGQRLPAAPLPMACAGTPPCPRSLASMSQPRLASI